MQNLPPFLYRNLETVAPLTEICVKHIVGNFRGEQTPKGCTPVPLLVLMAGHNVTLSTLIRHRHTDGRVPRTVYLPCFALSTLLYCVL